MFALFFSLFGLLRSVGRNENTVGPLSLSLPICKCVAEFAAAAAAAGIQLGGGQEFWAVENRWHLRNVARHHRMKGGGVSAFIDHRAGGSITRSQFTPPNHPSAFRKELRRPCSSTTSFSLSLSLSSVLILLSLLLLLLLGGGCGIG